PWEPVDTGGELVHVTLSSIDGAPVLFWLNFLDDPRLKAGADAGTDPSSTTVNAQLSWIARLSNGTWSKTQDFSSNFTLPRLQPTARLESAYALIPEHSPPKVVVNVFGPDATIETGPSQPPIPDGVVPFNQLVNVTAMGIAILVTVQNDNDDYVDAD